MKVYVIKYKDMDFRYLMGLLRKKTINYDNIMTVLEKKLDSVNIKVLFQKWVVEDNRSLKDLIEYIIANKLLIYTPLTEYENLPPIMKKYLSEVTSIDAIYLLLQSRNRDIANIANNKYREIFDAYLESFEKTNDGRIMYANEGDDSALFVCDSKILTFKKRKKKK